MNSTWCVYIVSNNAHTLYCGMTNDLPVRVKAHKLRLYPNSFTARYTFDRLVYYEASVSQRAAAARERQIKAWRRSKKIELIQNMNPNWIDLRLPGRRHFGSGKRLAPLIPRYRSG